MRVAETRAVNRALRKAYGIGLCSVEELGWLTGSTGGGKDQTQPANPPPGNGSSNGQPKLRDRLCVLIRQYNLNPTLLKAYATDFCGTQTLSEANGQCDEGHALRADETPNNQGIHQAADLPDAQRGAVAQPERKHSPSFG